MCVYGEHQELVGIPLKSWSEYTITQQERAVIIMKNAAFFVLSFIMVLSALQSKFIEKTIIYLKKSLY